MRLFRTKSNVVVEEDGRCVSLPGASWDGLLNLENLGGFLEAEYRRLVRLGESALSEEELLPPIENQEVWAAGVTYYRSRDARIEESRTAGSDTHYDRVYTAERPELFFKSTPHRVVGHLQTVRIRRDSKWTVPEPELGLAINASGRIIGYTVGNDMSARDIEGENPLYLPQAKIYDGCCALGPGILIGSDPLPEDTEIRMEIVRSGQEVFAGFATIGQMKREPLELVRFLFFENSFPKGCILLTGTGVVPPGDFRLQAGDEVRINVDGIGRLLNLVTGGPETGPT